MNAIKKIVMGLAVACAAVVCSAADIYVAKTGNDDTGDGSQGASYATIAKGIEEAKTAGGGTVYVGAGTYTEYGLVLDAAVEVVGTGATRDDVIVNANAKGRAFTLSAAGAALRNLTVQNGKVSGHGPNVYMTQAGIVSNCVIKSGQCGASGNQGANIWMSAGLVEDSEIIGGTGNGSNTCAGFSIYATGGRICRCKIRDAVYEKMSSIAVDLEGAVTLENSMITGCKAGASGNTPYILRVNNASAKVVNCTVVDNTAIKYGVRVDNASAQVVNTVIYNNGGTKEKEWGNNNAAKFVNCAFAADAAYSGTASTVKNLKEKDFFNVQTGDYHLSASSACKDAGSDASYPADCSATDLDGNPRKSPADKPIDIGCYELDQSKVSVSGVAACDYVYLGSALDFTATAVGGEGAYTYKWDFGDGSSALETAEATVSHTYAAPGLYEVSVTAKAGAGDYVTPYVLPVNTCVVRQDLWVDATNGDDAGDGTSESPFKTLGKAFSCLVNNVSAGATVADGVTVHIVSGTYVEYGFQIGSAVTVKGEGATRGDVVINGNSKGRVFSITGANARIENLTVKGGKTSTADVNGQNIAISAAGVVVSNCVISGGVCGAASGGNYGGNVYMSADSTVVDCEIVGGSGNGTNTDQGFSTRASAGRFMRCTLYNASYSKGTSYAHYLEGTAKMENCLVKANTSSGPVVYLATANNRVVNCTIVGNNGNQGAVKSNNGSAKVVNCAFYSNGGTAAKEWGNANAGSFVNCAFAANASYSGTASTIKDLTDAAFADYANGDYTPVAGGALVDAGDTAGYTTYGAISTTDLASNDRIQNDVIDIGCYEAAGGPKADMSVSVTDATDITYDGYPHAATVTVTEPTAGATITWDNGTTGVNGPSYTNAGFYTNTFTVTASGYNDYVGTGVVEIAKDTIVVSGVTFPNATYRLDEAPDVPALSGALPTGVTVAFAGYEKTVGAHEVTATFVTDANHVAQPASLTATITIEAVPLTPVTVSWGATALTYSGEAQAPVATLEGVAAGADVTPVISGSETAVGTGYTATVTGLAGADAALYELSDTPSATFSIAAKPVTVAWGKTSFYYTGEPQVPSATAVGVIGSEEVTVTVEGAKTDVGSGYTATATGLAGANAANYTLSGTLTTTFEITESLTDVYVATTGNDATGDGTPENPYATIAKGIAEAKAIIEGGETSSTVYVGAGTYEEYGLVVDAAVKIVGTGATRDDVVIDGKSLGQVLKITGANARVENLMVKGGRTSTTTYGQNIAISAAGVVVSNCVISGGICAAPNGGNYGGNVYMSANSTVVDCEIVGGQGNGVNTCYGFSTRASAGRFVRCTMRNASYGPGSTNTAVHYLEGTAIMENCLIKDNTSNYAVVLLTSANNRVVNCTIVGNNGKSGAVRSNNASAKVVNCVIYNNGGNATKEWASTNPGCFVNCAFAAAAAYTGATSTLLNLTDAAFKNYADGDYSPAADGALVDMGDTEGYTTYGATSTTDLAGNDRVQDDAIDIGCYEVKGIPKKDMVVSVSSVTTEYDGEACGATVLVTDPATGWTITWDDESTGANGPSYTNAGSYTNVFTVTARGYNDFVGTGVVEIAKATIDTSGVSFQNATYPLDEAPDEPVLSGTLPAGVTVAFTGYAKTVGEHAVTATFETDANHVAQPASLTATYTITPVALKQVTVSWGATALTYSGELQVPVATLVGVGEGRDVTPVIEGFRAAVGSGYTATVTGLAGADAALYELSGTTVTTFSIAAMPVTVAWGKTSFYYTGEPQLPSATAVGVIGSETVTVTVEGTQTEVGSGYTATATGLAGADAANYTLSGTLTTTFEITEVPAGIYVATTGNDDTGDGTEELPYATIAKGVEVAKAFGGTTVYVADGNYASPFATLDCPVQVVGNVEHPENVVITDSTASQRAFTLTHADARVAGVKITGGTPAANFNGGHINMTAGTVEHCIIQNGRTGNPGYGGNVYMTGGLLTDCQILGGSGNGTNSGTSFSIHATGGRICRCEIRDAVYQKRSDIAIDLEGAVTMENTLITGCKVGASDSTPYILKVNNANAKVVNCTIVGNTAAKYGVYVQNGFVYNTVIYDNGGTAAKEWGGANPAKFVNCAFAADADYSGTASTVKDLTDADFADYAGGDYTPAAGGALVNVGDNLSYPSDCSTTDLKGSDRFQDEIIDIGCYEAAGAARKDMTVVVTSITTDYDGETHAATVTVTDPAANYTITWDDGTTGSNGPAYVSGFHTNAFTVTATGDDAFRYNAYNGQGFVDITNGPIVATVTGATGPADGTGYSCTVEVTDPAGGWTVKWADENGAYTLDQAPVHKAKGVHTDSVKVSAKGYADFIGQGVVEITEAPIGGAVIFK